VLRIRDVYPGSRILIFTHPGSRIPDLGSRIPFPKTGRKERGEKNFFVKHSRQKFGPNFKELWNFLPKKLSLSSQKYGFGIRDPRSGIRKKPIPDPGSRG
jgi:hypothetical protein